MVCAIRGNRLGRLSWAVVQPVDMIGGWGKNTQLG